MNWLQALLLGVALAGAPAPPLPDLALLTPTLAVARPTEVPLGQLTRIVLPAEWPGGVVESVTVRAPDTDPERTVTGRGARFERVDSRFVALVPVSYFASPGRAQVELEAIVRLPSGSRLTLPLAAEFDVLARDFPEQRLTVSNELAETLVDPRRARDARVVAEVKSSSAAEPAWSGPLAWPIQGRLTTAYGQGRRVNGRVTGRHSGLDLAAPTGTPVLAAAPGRVVLTERLVVTGSTVIVDHGLGLFTSYNHMSTIDVQVGDWVETGQQVGRVGATGFATGPHLHWTVSIGQIPTDPIPLTKADPLAEID